MYESTTYHYRVNLADQTILSFHSESNKIFRKTERNNPESIARILQYAYTPNTFTFSNFYSPGDDGIWQSDDDISPLEVTTEVDADNKVNVIRKCHLDRLDNLVSPAGTIASILYDEEGHVQSKITRGVIPTAESECDWDNVSNDIFKLTTYTRSENDELIEITWDSGADNQFQTEDDFPIGVIQFRHNAFGKLNYYISTSLETTGNPSQVSSIWTYRYDQDGKVTAIDYYESRDSLLTNGAVSIFPSLQSALADATAVSNTQYTYLGLNPIERRVYSGSSNDNQPGEPNSIYRYAYDTFPKKKLYPY